MERSAPRRPDRQGRSTGLAYALWLPDDPPPWPAVVIVHGAGSRKENHADFARLATAAGWAALAFDLPGHGDSEPPMSGAAVADLIAMAALLGSQEGVDARRVAVRGSSLGGFLAITAAAASSRIAGVIAICPPSQDQLAGGLRRGNLEMRVDDPLGLEAWLMAQDIGGSVDRIAPRPLILMHAEGDTQVPSDHSEELYERAGEPRKLVIVPGGAHRTVQHDAELQGMALRWLERELAAGRPSL
ncbi:MAG TPA: alpha/beta fold hydrolase [Solirubrobacterales bacterium]|nr:alpha/beta fold hydrolase [Solirubrobacterales bacterium]